MGAASFASRVDAMIRKPRSSFQSSSIADKIIFGCYGIIRKTKSYRFEDIMNDNFLASHYFILINLINKEVTEERRALKKAQKKNK